ncbi:MAG: hypothetical protein RL768_2982, partial [Nitrospirota bacterium]
MTAIDYPPSHPYREPYERNLLPDPEGQWFLDTVWIHVGAKQPAPDREQRSKIRLEMKGIIAVMDVVVPRRDDHPFQPIRPP